MKWKLFAYGESDRRGQDFWLGIQEYLALDALALSSPVHGQSNKHLFPLFRSAISRNSRWGKHVIQSHRLYLHL